MTPRALDPDLVHGKLRLIDETVDNLASVGEVDADRLRADPILCAAVERLVTRAVDLAVSANSHVVAALMHEPPQTYRASFQMMATVGALTPELADRISGSAGLRNLIVHLYGELDLDRLAAAVPMLVADYRDYVAHVARFLLELDTRS